jgi:hypothetical protein
VNEAVTQPEAFADVARITRGLPTKSELHPKEGADVLIPSKKHNISPGATSIRLNEMEILLVSAF